MRFRVFRTGRSYFLLMVYISEAPLGLGITISYLKNVFWPKLFVGALFQILEIL
jgi:hypothetical protein